LQHQFIYSAKHKEAKINNNISKKKKFISKITQDSGLPGCEAVSMAYFQEM
jgi:hypothetical protein